MKKRKILTALALIALCAVMCVTACAETTKMQVVGGWLRLRAEASYTAKVIASYPSGSVVTVISQADGWSYVLTGDYRIGYMDSRYLLNLTDTGTTTETGMTTGTTESGTRTWTDVNLTAWVTAKNGRPVRMRSTPSTGNGNIVTTYPVGTPVTLIRRSDDGWSYILVYGKYGYMMSPYLTTNATGSTGTTGTSTGTTTGTVTWTNTNVSLKVTSGNGRDVRLRSQPVVNTTNVTGLYPVGRTVKEIRRSTDGWSYIKVDGKYGYMMTKFLTTY